MNGEIVATLAVVAFGVLLLAAIIHGGRPTKCADARGHCWDYGRQGGGGWGVVRCTRCDYSDIY